MVFIGAHISRQKTLINTIDVIKEAGGNALQIFISSPKSIKINNINEKYFGSNLSLFKDKNFKIVIHSPYTINIATPFNINKRSIDIIDCYWIQLILHELKIADLMGAVGCVIHCGKYTKQDPKDGLKNMKNALDFIINEIKKNKWESKIILETSSGQGTELLFNYEEFLNFYNLFTEEQKNFIKICIDTCHVWAAGYELNEIYELTKKNKNFENIALIHVNNSKNPKLSNLDRHDIIDKGYINLDKILEFVKLFKIANKNIIFILETPNEPELKKEFLYLLNIE